MESGRMVRGPGSGRDDMISALLSDGEYVIDAETVALLGDGSVEEGSRRLDEMRKNLRRHKGRALARGKFTPKAKNPEAYLGKVRRAKGGKTRLDTLKAAAKRETEMSAEEFLEWAQAANILPEDLVYYDKEMLRSTFPLLSEKGAEEVELFVQQYLKNKSGPTEHAKGGRIRGDWVRRIVSGDKEPGFWRDESLRRDPGGRPRLSEEERIRRLRQARRMLEAYKQKDEKAKGGKVKSQKQSSALRELRALAELLKKNLEDPGPSLLDRKSEVPDRDYARELRKLSPQSEVLRQYQDYFGS